MIDTDSWITTHYLPPHKNSNEKPGFPAGFFVAQRIPLLYIKNIFEANIKILIYRMG